MKILKKVIIGVAALSVMAMQFAGVSFAADNPTCLKAAANTGKVAVGDTFSVEIKMSEMTASSYAGGIRYDADYVSAPTISDSTAVLSGTRTDTKEENNLTLHAEQGKNNNVGLYGVGAYDTAYSSGDVTVLTFTAKKAGTAKFSLYEDYDVGNKDQINEEFGIFSIDILGDSGTADITIVDGEGDSHTITAEDIKKATSVTITDADPWGYGTNKFVGTFYSLANIFNNAGLDVSDAHGIKAVASDGFATGFSLDDIDNLYIYDQGAVKKNGTLAGTAGTYGTAIKGTGAAGNKWAKNVVKISVATDHEWFVKGGACKHYCSICNAAEPGITLINGTKTEQTVYDCDIKKATSVTTTDADPWGYKSNKFVGTFYSLANIFNNAGLDVSDAHGIKAVASDGFATGFSSEDIDNLYIYDMGAVKKNGTLAGTAGTYGTAIKGTGAAGNKWAKDVVKISVATDHEWFVKGGACNHYCSICGESEPFTLSSWQWVTTAEPYTAKAVLHYNCGGDSSKDAVVTSKSLSDGANEYTATIEVDGTKYTDVKKSSGTGSGTGGGAGGGTGGGTGGGAGGGTGGGAGAPSGDIATQDTKIDPADAQNNLFGTANTIDITGKERSETSMQLADQVKKTLGVEKFSTIILASGTDFPDGLGVSALSIQQRAPVLIVTPGTEASIKKYIEENLVYDGKVIISGGTGAVSQNMQNLLNGIDVTRLGGADRYKTNLLTIQELLSKGASRDEILIASGKDFADALSASATGKIIMIVGDKLTDEQKELLGETGFGKVTILGGTGAVSGDIEGELNSVTGKTAERVGGKDRIETSKLIAARYFPNSATSVYTKANGFADGLAGGLLANLTGSPIRLAYGSADMTAGGKSVTLGGVK